MTNIYIKLFIGLVLFGTWAAVVFYKVQGAEALVEFIKYSLTGLGAYHLSDQNPKNVAQGEQPPSP